MENKEVHNRREFFKITAKKVLPVIGIISIANIPLFGNSICSNCNYGCSYTAQGTATPVVVLVLVDVKVHPKTKCKIA